MLPGITSGNEYGDNGVSQHRGSRKNIQLGKQSERAVSLVTQHRLNQTQGSNQLSQTALIKGKVTSGKPGRTNLSGIQRRNQ